MKFKCKSRERLKIYKQKNIHKAKSKQKTARDRFQDQNQYTRNKEKPCIIIKGSIPQKDIILIKVFMLKQSFKTHEAKFDNQY